MHIFPDPTKTEQHFHLRKKEKNWLLVGEKFWPKMLAHSHLFIIFVKCAYYHNIIYKK